MRYSLFSSTRARVSAARDTVHTHTNKAYRTSSVRGSPASCFDSRLAAAQQGSERAVPLTCAVARRQLVLLLFEWQ